jgi:hypothetical protein
MNEVEPREVKPRTRGKSPETRLMELCQLDDKDPATAEKIRALRSIVARRDKAKQDTERQRLIAENLELERKVAELKAQVTAAPVTATDIAQLDSMRVAQLRIVAQSESEIGQRARAMVEEYERIRREEGNDLKAEIRWSLQRQQRQRAALAPPAPRALAPVPTRPMSTAG